ncbi:MAG TPA: CHAT domain-containing protein [Longimicrobium sp.]|jgi:TPR repeat protein
MKKVKVLFFAADPTAVLPENPTPPLQLGADMREIRKRVEEDGHPSTLDFDCQFDARPKDLIDRLRLTRPHIVHFSGHGNVEGLKFTSPNGVGAQLVTGAALKDFLKVIPNEIRLVVLSACYSRDQAESIAEVVGCAIGTPGGIMDEDAIQFNAAFYGSIARGESVQDAFDLASAELGVSGPGGTTPQLLRAKGVDPSKLFLVPKLRRRKQGRAAAAILAVSALIVASKGPRQPTDSHLPPGFRALGCVAPSTSVAMPDRTMGAATSAVTSGAADLEEAKVLCAAGEADSAVHVFEKLARAGNAEALGLEAIAYITGRGAIHHPELGVKKLREAAYKGDLRSMAALATAYQTGYGAKASQYYARLWLNKAARRGDAEAMRRLGVVHRQAKSDSALYWLNRAVAAGSADARVDLGYMYDAGILVARDTAEAVQQYVAAARAGSPQGMYAVGAVFQAGMGVKKDPVQAHRWFYKAACAGSPDAMAAIGEQFLNGHGVPADSGMAKRWLRLANAAGSTSAARKLHTLKTPEQPRQWRGPLAWALKRLGMAETHPQLSCSSEAGAGPA